MQTAKSIICAMVIFGFGCFNSSNTYFNANNSITEEYEQQVVSNYVDKYIASSNANNFVIGILLREVSLICITNNISSWEVLFEYQSNFFQNAKTNIISIEYPIKPSYEDIEITSEYIKSISENIMKNDPHVLSDIKHIIPQFSNILILRINDYEYNKRQNK